MNIESFKEIIPITGATIVILIFIWNIGKFLHSKIQPIKDARVRKILENTYGQHPQIFLPPFPGPQYNSFPQNTDTKPPRPITPIKAVDTNNPNSLFHQILKRTPVATIELHNKKFIAIFTSQPRKKKARYFKNHEAYRNEDFALLLNLGRFRREPKLLPAESSPTKIQDLIDQCEWLNAGPLSKFEWHPYGIVIYTSCQKEPRCNQQTCMMLVGGQTFQRTRVNDTEKPRENGKIIYGSSGLTFEEATQQLGKNANETRIYMQKLISNIRSNCDGLSIITTDQEGMITKMEDRNPDATERETGWVLHRDKIELPDYRIRQVDENSYQAIIYPCGLNGEELSENFEEFRTSEPQFPTRNQWTEAVNDLFETLAPRAEPIIGIPEDQWLPPDFT